MRESITKNFYRDEFACNGFLCCGNSAPINWLFVEKLQIYRDQLGLGLIVNSGFRCLTYNRSIGSKDTSQHPIGVAADIKIPKGLDIIDMLIAAEQLDIFGGVGGYETFIHLDDGPRGRRWGIQI